MMQIDLVEQKGPFYKFVLSGNDVFTKYLFEIPLTNGSADTVARELVKIFFQHSYLPSTIVIDTGNFTSKLLAELTKLLEVKLKHATLKQPQTIGVVERSHASLKRILKFNSNEQWNDWHMYRLQPLYTTHLIILQLIVARQLFFMDVNLLNALISAFLHDQCQQLKSIQITYCSYKTQCFKNLAKIN